MRYQISHGIVKYAADTILEDINFEIKNTEKIAIVGRNGCGKTTLLKLIAGELELANIDSDEEAGISMAGTQRIGYLKQLSFEDENASVESEIKKVFAPVYALEDEMKRMEKEMESRADDRILKEYANKQAQYEALGGYSCQRDLETIFQSFGFALSDLKRPIGTFSGGQQTRIAFVKLLLSRPDIMLLDEPTNHLDMTTIEWLENYLKSYEKAVVIVSHDRMFLDNVIDVTYEIEYHKMKRYPGNYSAFVVRKRQDADKQAKDYEEQQQEIKRLTEWIEKWKNTPTKVAATRSKRMVIEHMVKIEKPRRFDSRSFHAQFAPLTESYKEVLNVNKLAIGYENVLSVITFLVQKGERVAVIGENGKGKSTLLKTITSAVPALGGSFSFGTGVQWGYFDQQAALTRDCNPETTVLQDFWDMYPNLLRNEVRTALGNFLFSQEDVEKKLGQLSGGEKVRLELCKLFKKRPNFLILDEPTNHMDIIGKEALESMLKQYTGAVLFVSHDRYFIKEVATNLLVFEDGKCVFYPCTYEEYLNMNKQKKEVIEKAPKAVLTLNDVPKQEKYVYNPGKEASKRKKLVEKLEMKLDESEEKLMILKMQMVDPEIATDFEKLNAIQEEIDKEKEKQDQLLDELAEIETKCDAQEFL